MSVSKSMGRAGQGALNTNLLVIIIEADIVAFVAVVIVIVVVLVIVVLVAMMVGGVVVLVVLVTMVLATIVFAAMSLLVNTCMSGNSVTVIRFAYVASS